MAKCFDVTGYIEPCNVVRQKYTGRALLITGIGYNGLLAFSDNGIIVNKVGPDNGFSDFVLNNRNSCFEVSLDAQNPFGVTIQGNTDNGRVSYTKTIPVSIPATRDGKAEEFVMGLQKGLYVSSLIILETYGTNANGSNGNDIFGAYSPVRLDPTSVTRSEYENGGAWSFNLVCEEPIPNVICTMSGLDEALDTLFNV